MTAAGREPHHRALLARVVPLRAGCAALAAVEARLPRGPTPAVPPPGTVAPESGPPAAGDDGGQRIVGGGPARCTGVRPVRRRAADTLA